MKTCYLFSILHTVGSDSDATATDPIRVFTVREEAVEFAKNFIIDSNKYYGGETDITELPLT
jgi:hypothetical protein